jgi:hypothetical protein
MKVSKAHGLIGVKNSFNTKKYLSSESCMSNILIDFRKQHCAHQKKWSSLEISSLKVVYLLPELWNPSEELHTYKKTWNSNNYIA